MRVAVIGTGVLGRAVAERLRVSGLAVTVYNRTRERAEPLAPLGAVIASSPGDAMMESDCALLLLSDASAIRSVILNEETRPALCGRTLIQMGTIGPKESRDFAKAVTAEGGDYLEAPVLGSVAEAKAGTLLAMVGGHPDQMRRWEPLLHCLAREPRYAGPVGQAALLKLALNHLIAAETAAFSLSLALIQQAQVPVDLFMAVLKESALFAPTFEKKLPRMQQRRYDDPNFSTQHLLKDVELVLAASKQHGLRTDGLEGVRRLIDLAISDGYGEGDYSSLYEALKQDAPPKARQEYR